MAIKLPIGTFQCPICSKIYESDASANACKDSHEMIYFPISKTELNRLTMFIQTGDASLLPDSLLERLEKYKRNAVRS